MIDIDEIVNQGKILLFYLGKGRFGDQAAGLLASQIVSRIRHSVMERGTGNDVRPFYLYADEFQLFADGRFAELLAEGRKFKLALTIAHQYTDQLAEEILEGVLGNVGTVIAFRIGAIDGERMESSFAPIFKGRDLVSLPNFRAYVRSFGRLGQTPFSIKTLPSADTGDPEAAAAIRQLSRLKYGRHREEVEEEIRTTYEAYGNLSS
jgi:DNA helicase HerA-like ATPase